MKGILSPKQLLVMGGALFAMHFGASCMLYPVHWGKMAGNSVLTAFLGILITGLILPLLAYVALSRGQGNFRNITSRFSPKFGPIFCLGTIVVLGPLFVVPRMSAAAWDAILQFTGIQFESKLPALLFSIIYYALTYWFAASKSKTMEKIGNILSPILILIVVAVILKGIITPIGNGWVPSSSDKPAFVYGFLEGYATADLLCSLMFGLVIISGLRNAGVPEEKMNSGIIKVGLVGIGLLVCTHFGHMIVGANTGGSIDLEYAQLYTEVVRSLWGNVGGFLFTIALVAAALTTAVGLTGATAEYIDDAYNGKISYKVTALITCISSIAISNIGLDAIVTIVTPVLDLFYPGAIVMVLYYAFMPDVLEGRKLAALRLAFYGATICGLIDVIAQYCRILNVGNGFLSIYNWLPLSQYKMTWVVLSPALFIAGLFVIGKIQKSKMSAQF